MSELVDILNALDEQRNAPAALATLVGVEGSSYRRPGARLLLLPNGKHVGSISGGCLEEDLRERAGRVLATGCSEIATYDTIADNDLVWGVGLGCQGLVRIFIERLPALRPGWVRTLTANLTSRRKTAVAVVFGGTDPTGTALASELTPGTTPDNVFHETIRPPPALVVFGAGDDARPVVRIAKDLGWHLTVADARTSYATTARFPEADSIVSGPVSALADQVAPDEHSFAVVMTHRYADDHSLLRALLPRPLAYLGVLGPRKRTDRLLAQLDAEGLPIHPDMLEKLHAPMGLDLGGSTPESVALSIVAEVQARLTQRIPTFLRDRPGPIHA
jgi:xanthine dehydrogenase accessory factor